MQTMFLAQLLQLELTPRVPGPSGSAQPNWLATPGINSNAQMRSQTTLCRRCPCQCCLTPGECGLREASSLLQHLYGLSHPGGPLSHSNFNRAPED